MSTIHKKLLIVVVLSLAAIGITYLRERKERQAIILQNEISRTPVSREKISAVVDTTLRIFGIGTDRLRRPKIAAGRPAQKRDELRIVVPPEFDISKFMVALKDSFQAYPLTILSTENLREKSSSVHIKTDQEILQTLLFTREVRQKGAASSPRKQQTRQH